MNKLFLTLSTLFVLCGCSQPTSETSSEDYADGESGATYKPQLVYDGEEKHLSNMMQLTYGGDNAEAYFNPAGTKIVWQKKNEKEGIPCDQIFIADLGEEGLENVKRISNGEGRTTCAYFLGEEHIIYASTHESGAECPEEPSKDQGYVWPIYNTFEIYKTDLTGGNMIKMTDNEFYDAEATVSPDGSQIVFTSTRDGDLDLYIMDANGENVKRITTDLGYDGGAFFSHDGKMLIWRSSRPTTEEEVATYNDYLSRDLVKPSHMELYYGFVDGSEINQITKIEGANWAPFFHPSDEKVIFSSNHASERGFPFNLYMVDLNGENLEQITYSEMFNAFAMFSPNGKKLIFGSNRNGKDRETNLFIADWKD